ncbi:hypothetical protein OUZ56_013654 [Daphnia magna]|uniref:Uncharacterized protein n=1 Tax=Daphnia magna TaxID=35525 RepID=A0ABQ9Z6J2_9CRUS|nr:hypothetical protein OUZ56_013654 [Daphnia magna]
MFCGKVYENEGIQLGACFQPDIEKKKESSWVLPSRVIYARNSAVADRQHLAAQVSITLDINRQLLSSSGLVSHHLE